MGQGRRRNRKALLAIAALSSALGACEAEQVLVGTARDSLHLDVCMGASTVCEPELSAETLAMPAPSSCGAELGPELEPEFSVDLFELLCADESESCVVAKNLVVAPDGTSWVLGKVGSNPWAAGELWLARISAEGELLERIDASHGIVSPPENSVTQETALVLDERGHVFVLVYEMDAGPNADSPLVERSWLTEYDAEGAVASGPNMITGLGKSRLASTPDGKLVIAANATQNGRHGVLAALDAQGELLWSQNGVRTNGQGVGYGVVGLAVAANDSFVLAERTRSGDDTTYGLTRFDTDGNAIWDRLLERSLAHARVYGAGDAHVLVGAVTLGGENWLGLVDEDGQVEWAHDFAGWAHAHSSTGLTVDADRGVALILDAGLAHAELIEQSLDGEGCTRHALPLELNTADNLAVDGGGVLHLMSGHLLSRVRLPAE
jgi:hypothetical protein